LLHTHELVIEVADSSERARIVGIDIAVLYLYASRL
jgi:hypothetical protein